MARILIIDDIREIRTYLRLILERAGHTVVDSTNGGQGLGAYEELPADLIFCDIFMPEKDGLETIQDLRKRWGNVRIIAMSGGNPRVPMDALPLATKLGAAKTLRKPFGVNEVLAAVAEVLQSRNPDGSHGHPSGSGALVHGPTP